MTDRVRNMVHEASKKEYTKTEILDRTYVKSGMSISMDGTKVLSILMNWGKME